MTTSTGEPRPIIPALAPFYDQARDRSWLLVRCTAGGFLLIHGIQKLTGNTVAGFAANSLARRGIEPSLALAYWIFFMETVGALCIFFGLFTRFFAVAAIVQFRFQGKPGAQWATNTMIRGRVAAGSIPLSGD